MTDYDYGSGWYQWCFMMVGAGLLASVHHSISPTNKCRIKFLTWSQELKYSSLIKPQLDPQLNVHQKNL